MAAISAAIHQFHRGKVDDDGSSLYASFRYVNGTFDTISNERVRSLVADRIKNRKLYRSSLENDTKYKKSDKDDCNPIVNGDSCSGENELEALAMLSRLVIRVVSIRKTAQDSID